MQISSQEKWNHTHYDQEGEQILGSNDLQRQKGITTLMQFSAGQDKKEDLKEDPSAGMMNMMKKMYEDGDDNMKRTIAEAWTKANDKKTEGKGPDFSDRYDFLNK